MKFSIYRYVNCWVIGIGKEKVFKDYSTLKFGLGWYCFSIIWKTIKITNK